MKMKTIWSFIIVVFILLVVGVLYYFNSSSYAIFSDDIYGEKTIELSISSANNCDVSVNKPELDYNMIPVIYNQKNNVWEKADKNNANNSWYDYCEKKWANIVTVKDNRDLYLKANVGTEIKDEDINAMFVWIPRYKYKVWNYNESGTVSSKEKEILLTFEKDDSTTGDIKCKLTNDKTEVCESSQKACTDDSCNGKTYTHPAFKDDYKGLWVSKFELSGKLDKITIKPNKKAIDDENISDLNSAIYDMYSKDNEYGFEEKTNIHMINNLEWGAVSYFTNSKYGRCDDGNCTEVSNNNCSLQMTGIGGISVKSKGDSDVCNNYLNKYNGEYGVLASTTGNVYGIYDMSGGNYEYVMGVASNDDEVIPGASGYTSSQKLENTNFYKYTEDATDLSISILGDAIKEVKNGATAWYGNSNYVSYDKWPWIVRGGSSKDIKTSGIFSSGYSSGSAASNYSTRVVIAK